MHTVGTVESLWRYPVKSMRGEQLEMAYAGFSGIYGDRIYAIHDVAAQAGFPYLTAREQEKMLLFRPIFGDIQRSLKPDNQDEAAAISPNINPIYGDPADLGVTVQAPNGETLKIDDPALISLLREGLPERHQLRLVRSQRAMTDCRPLSIFSTQTAQKIGYEIGTSVDKRRFRANISELRRLHSELRHRSNRRRHFVISLLGFLPGAAPGIPEERGRLRMKNSDIFVGRYPLNRKYRSNAYFLKGAGISNSQATLWKLRGLHKTNSRLCRTQ